MGELPHDVDWAFVFRIDPDGNVSRVSSTSQEKRFHQMQPVPDNSMYNSEDSENKGKYFFSILSEDKNCRLFINIKVLDLSNLLALPLPCNFKF